MILNKSSDVDDYSYTIIVKIFFDVGFEESVNFINFFTGFLTLNILPSKYDYS